MSTKKNKWLHEFVVNKEEKIKESHTEVNDKGEKITTEIYKPVWQFDNRWTCVSGDKSF